MCGLCVRSLLNSNLPCLTAAPNSSLPSPTVSIQCRNSADFQMQSDMQRLALQHGSACAIACVSNDNGFAPALRHAASKGCFTVAGTAPLKTRRRPPWAPPPDYSRFPLPAAAGRCLVWDHRWLPGPQQAAEEAALAATWAEREPGYAPPPLPCPGGVTQRWMAEERRSSISAEAEIG